MILIKILFILIFFVFPHSIKTFVKFLSFISDLRYRIVI